MDSDGTHEESSCARHRRFLAITGTSTVPMYGLMFLDAHVLDHVLLSKSPLWMAIIMLAVILGMYTNWKSSSAKSSGRPDIFPRFRECAHATTEGNAESSTVRG